MNHTTIEWVKNPDGSQGYTWNPLTGCLNHVNGICKGGDFPCYAYRLAHGRLKQRYLANRNIAPIGTMIPGAAMNEKALTNPFYPRFWPEKVEGYSLTNSWYSPKGIFVCDMSDLFGISIPEEWTRRVLVKILDGRYKLHRFYLLTKQPQNLKQFSPFPDNCWVGVTACNEFMLTEALWRLSQIQAKVKYISVEPFLKRIPQYVGGLKNCSTDWVIIGALTGTYQRLIEEAHKYPDLTLTKTKGAKWALQPRIEWVREIVEAADKAGIPVFLKHNLNSENLPDNAFNKDGLVRQEMPSI